MQADGHYTTSWERPFQALDNGHLQAENVSQ